MAFCTSCGQHISDGVRFCGSCGAKQESQTELPTDTNTTPKHATVVLSGIEVAVSTGGNMSLLPVGSKRLSSGTISPQ